MTGASWDFSVEPQYGWGSLGKQKATAGWLAALPVFEPHWQVCTRSPKSSLAAVPRPILTC